MLLTKLITAVIVATATILGFATAGVISERKLPAGLKSPLEGYAIAEPIFSGTILGQDYKLNGTVQVCKQNNSVGSDKRADFRSKSMPNWRKFTVPRNLL